VNESPKPLNDICAMRDIAFDTLRALSDKENPMDLERAKTISTVMQTIINSAKVEIEAIQVIGGVGSGFIPALPPAKPSLTAVPAKQVYIGGKRVD
jgi:hypothetical protein